MRRSSVNLLCAISLLTAVVCVVGCAESAPKKSTGNTKTESAEKPNSVDLEALRPRVHKFCGDCHAVPDPATFPRKAWHDEVAQGYRFYEQSNRTDLSPPPMNDVVAYYRQLAPVELPNPSVVQSKTKPPIEFQPLHFKRPQGADKGSISFLRALKQGNRSSALAVCDMKTGELSRVAIGSKSGSRLPQIMQLGHPAHIEPCDLNGDHIEDFIVAELGSFLPADHSKGQVVWLRGKKAGGFERVVLLENVGRVADVRPADFDGDGALDLVVAEFGWRTTGRILLLRQTGIVKNRPQFEMTVLDKRHGAIHVPVADLNGDSKPDFVALISQEHETVVAFLNRGDGRFEKKTIFTAGDPSFGSSGIQLVDLDRDGDLDVVYTNGDSFDSFYLKPYHAVRWLENRGRFPFTEHELTRMPGVSKAIAADLDGDGDLDIAAAAYIPVNVLNRAGQTRYDSLIWLEQTSSGKFTRHRIEQSKDGHLALEVGDFNGDGRLDLGVGMSHVDTLLTIWIGQPRER